MNRVQRRYGRIFCHDIDKKCSFSTVLCPEQYFHELGAGADPERDAGVNRPTLSSSEPRN